MSKQQKQSAFNREKQFSTRKPSAADFLDSPPISEIIPNNDNDIPHSRERKKMSKQQKQSAFNREKQFSTRKPSAADFLDSPPISEIIPNNDNDTPKYITNSSPQETKTPAAATVITRRKTTTARTKKNAWSYRKMKQVSSLEELKELSSGWLDSIKRQAERSHSDILKEVEASNFRLYKHLKIQTQSCQKLMDDIDKDFKKMMERINESCEAVKGSYDEFQAEVQASHSNVCKTSTPKKTQHLEDTINAVRS